MSAARDYDYSSAPEPDARASAVDRRALDRFNGYGPEFISTGTPPAWLLRLLKVRATPTTPALRLLPAVAAPAATNAGPVPHIAEAKIAIGVAKIAEGVRLLENFDEPPDLSAYAADIELLQIKLRRIARCVKGK